MLKVRIFCIAFELYCNKPRIGKSKLKIKDEVGCGCFLPRDDKKNATGDCWESSHFTSCGRERAAVFCLAIFIMPENRLSVKKYNLF